MSLYTIIGGDGNEYGPVTGEDLRNWIRQGRANAATQVRAGEGEWSTLGAMPEFAPLFGSSFGGSPSPSSVHEQSSSTPSFPGTGAPAQSTYGSGTGSRETVLALMDPLSRAAGWMKLMAVMMFIFAGIYTLASFGFALIIMWIPIWQGVLLWKAASRARAAMVDGSELTAQAAMESIKTYFVLLGVLTLIGLLLVVAGFILAMVGAFNFDPAQFQQY